MAGPWGSMNPILAQRLQAMMAASGGLIGPGSGFRSNAEQARLYALWKAGKHPAPRVAPPGRSHHETGDAMDLVDLSTGKAVKAGSAAHKWLLANAANFGIRFPMNDEPWHAELADKNAGYLEGSGWGSFQGDDDYTSYNMLWGMDDQSQNPQDVLANRLHAVMRIVGGSPAETEEAEAAVEGATTDASLIQPPTPPMATGMGQAPTTGTMGPSPRNMPGGGGGGNDPSGYGAFARSLFGQHGWGPEQYAALVHLWNKESGNPRDTQNVTWNPNAKNPTSTAYGIAQFLNGTWAGTGIARTSDPQQQIRAGLMYIKSRYGSPQAALQFHKSRNWY